jgi:hypothetical protein
MALKIYNVEKDGIFIPTDELVKLKKHYEEVQKHCINTSWDKLARYYEGKTDILNDILSLIQEELKKRK